jgi:hypothetical protein
VVKIKKLSVSIFITPHLKYVILSDSIVSLSNATYFIPMFIPGNRGSKSTYIVFPLNKAYLYFTSLSIVYHTSQADKLLFEKYPSTSLSLCIAEHFSSNVFSSSAVRIKSNTCSAAYVFSAPVVVS